MLASEIPVFLMVTSSHFLNAKKWKKSNNYSLMIFPVYKPLFIEDVPFPINDTCFPRLLAGSYWLKPEDAEEESTKMVTSW